MSKDFEEQLNEIILERTEEIDNDVVVKNDKIQKNNMKAEELFHKIIEALPENQKKLIYEFEDTKNCGSTISNEIMYKHGLIDGFKSGNN